MKKRTLVILIVVLVLLVLVGRRLQEPAPVAKEGPVSGSLVLEGVDINQAAKVTVVNSAGTSCVAKIKGKWVVPGLFNYSADFGRLSMELRSLAELKVGQVVRGGADSLGEFGLAESNATQVILQDTSGQTLDELFLGAPRVKGGEGPFGGAPRGQYLRVGDGPVLLVGEMIRRMAASDDGWIRREILRANVEEVASVTSVSTQGEYTIIMQAPGVYTMDGLKKDEQVDPGFASRLMNALQPLALMTVADPNTSNTVFGFDRPDRFTMKMKGGTIHTVQLGAPSGTGGRYARVTVDFTPPAAPGTNEVSATIPASNDATNAVAVSNHEAQVRQAFQKRMKEYQDKVATDRKQASDLNAEVSPWTYVLADYVCENMLVPRAQLVKKIEPPKPPEEPTPITPQAPVMAPPAAPGESKPQ
jgi:hypothetical protein